METLGIVSWKLVQLLDQAAAWANNYSLPIKVVGDARGPALVVFVPKEKNCIKILDYIPTEQTDKAYLEGGKLFV